MARAFRLNFERNEELEKISHLWTDTNYGTAMFETQYFMRICKHDKLVKSPISGWLSKKLHIRGVEFFYYFGVLEYAVMIEKLYPKGTSYGRTTKKMKSFYDAIKHYSQFEKDSP